ncbi:MAG: type II secretion system protein [bacterium]|nr:type II secretion system protein [bacterium]
MNNRGFSLLELIIVMAILAILSSGAVIWFFGYQGQAEVDSTSKMIVDTLRDAQSRSISGKDFKAWGVCFSAQENKFVLFRNDCNSNGAMDNGETGVDCGGGECFDCDLKCNGVAVKEDNYLASFVKIGNVSLLGGGNKIIFNNRGSGAAQYGTVRIEQTNSSASFKDIIVTSQGKIDRQ